MSSPSSISAAYLEFYDAVMYLILILAIVYLIGIGIKIVLPVVREVASRPAGATGVGLPTTGNGVQIRSVIETVEYLETLARDVEIDWPRLIVPFALDTPSDANTPYQLRIRLMAAVAAKHAATGILDRKFSLVMDMLVIPVSIRHSADHGATVFDSNSDNNDDLAWTFTQLAKALDTAVDTCARNLEWMFPMKRLFPSQYSYGDLRMCPLLVEWLRSVHMLELTGTVVETSMVACNVRTPMTTATMNNRLVSASHRWRQKLHEHLQDWRGENEIECDLFLHDVALAATGLSISSQLAEQFTMPVVDCGIVYNVDRAVPRSVATEQYIVLRTMVDTLATNRAMRAKILLLAEHRIHACLVSNITRLYEPCDRPISSYALYKRPYLFYQYFMYRWRLALRGPRYHQVRMVVCIARTPDVYAEIATRVGYSPFLLMPNPYIYHPQDDEYDYLDASASESDETGIAQRIRRAFATFASMSLPRRMMTIFALTVVCVFIYHMLAAMIWSEEMYRDATSAIALNL